ETELISRFHAPRHPTLFIVGAPRSGTTLLAQLLLMRFELGYINNVNARFWMAPYVGAVLAEALRNRSQPPDVGIDSEFGATRGYEGPHEFGYFWRRWFRYGETHDAEDTKVRVRNGALLRRELAAVESVFDRPLLLKNLACSFHVSFLAHALPRAIFVHCRRNPVFAAQSILLGRLKYHGDRMAWFSVKPAAYKRLRELPYPEQIAGQIAATRGAVERQLAQLPATRQLCMEYETLCERPEEELERIAARIAEHGHRPERRSVTLPAISPANNPSVHPEEFEALRLACDREFAAGVPRKEAQ
ncbi:MAG: sulfotransferase, partial [Gammaproteobacteria bacterium]|nr:sulfotransferase [Gammaproteobacteria bacterium]